MALNRTLYSFKVGDTVRFLAAVVGPDQGTVTQVTKRKVRVLFPIRKYLWMYPSEIVKVPA